MIKKHFSMYIFLLLSYSAYGQDTLGLKTPAELGQQIFYAFKTSNYDLFKSLLITEPEHELILTKLDAPDSVKAEYRKQGSGNILYLHNQAKQNFETILSKAKKGRIDWTNAELVEVKFNPRNKKGIERADVIIIAKSGDTTFFIGLENCHKSDSWHIMDEVELKIAN